MPRTIVALLLLIVGSVVSGVAIAQYVPPPAGRDYPRGPLAEFFDRNTPNPRLVCETYKRLDREGDVVWLRLECRADR